MTDAAEKTESLRDYAEVLGSPDPVTTDRMRARFDGWLQQRQDRRGRRWLRVAAGIVAVLALGIATAVVVATDHDATISADSERALELGGATLVLHPQTTVRPDAADEGRVELVAGELDVTATAAFVVRSGDYEIHAGQGRFSVRHTGAMPLVTVASGDAMLFGPDLPETGIRILESPTR